MYLIFDKLINPFNSESQIRAGDIEIIMEKETTEHVG